MRDFKQAAATDLLRELLKDPDRDVRWAAVVGLAWKRDPVDLLLGVLSDRDNPHRDHAVHRLGDFPDDARAVAAVQAATDDADKRVRETAQSVMKSIRRGLESRQLQSGPGGGR